MITLELAPEVEKLLIKTAEQQGITVNQLVTTLAEQLPKSQSVADLLRGRRKLTSFPEDLVAWQREQRDE